MPKAPTIIKLFVFILAFSGFSLPASAQDNITISTPPIILQTAKIVSSSENSIMVKGLIRPGSDALIYVNGVYSGLANISEGDNNLSIFSYISPFFTTLFDNEVMVIARDRSQGTLSSPAQSNVTSIINKTSGQKISQNTTNNLITPSLPAPTLKTPNQIDCEPSPFFSGFSKNQTTVKLFIDNKLYAAIPATSKVSESAFFKYFPAVTLERGNHIVYAVATDSEGKQSLKSKSIAFCVSDPKTTSTTSSETISSNASANTTSSTENLVFQKTKSATGSSTDQNRSGAKINLFLFILFILIIIVWIIFVNKELMEENGQTNQDKNPKK